MSQRAPLPGSPYHRLARTTDFRWWRPLVEVMLFLLFWLVLVGVFDAVHAAIAPHEGLGDGAQGLVSLGVMLGGATGAALLAARVVGRASGMVSSVVGRLRWRWLAVCAGLYVLSQALSFGLTLLTVVAMPPPEVPGEPEQVWLSLSALLPKLGLIVLIIPFQAAGEEYAMRGTFLQAIGAWTRSPWIGIAITSVAFAAMHAPEEIIVWVGLFATGVATAWITIRTGGLEAAIALHAVSNVVGFGFGAATGGFETWAATLNTDIPVLPTVIDVVVMFAMTWFVSRRASRSGISSTAA